MSNRRNIRNNNNLAYSNMPKVKLNVGGRTKNINLYKRDGRTINPTLKRYVRQFGTKSRGTNSIQKGLTKDVYLYRENGEWKIGKAKTRGRGGRRAGNAFANSTSRRAEDYKTFGSTRINARTGEFLSSAQADRFRKVRGNPFVYEPTGTVNVPVPTQTNELQGTTFFSQFRYTFAQELSQRQIYNFYRQQVANRGLVADLVLFSRETGNNRVAGITISSQNMATFESMIEFIETRRMATDKTTGSDRFFNEQEYQLMDNVLDIRFYRGRGVQGSAENIVYKTLQLPDKGVCGYLCLVHLFGDKIDKYMKDNNLTTVSFRSLDAIKEALIHFNCGWRFYSNAFCVPSKKDKDGVFNDRHILAKKFLPTPLIGKGLDTKACVLTEDDIIHKIISESPPVLNQRIINFIVDMTGKRFHIDLPVSQENPTQLLDDIRFTRNKIYKKKGNKYKVVFTRNTELQQSKTEQTKLDEMRFIFFDYETVVETDEKNMMKPYAVAYWEASLKDLRDIDEAEKNNSSIEGIGKSECFIGWDCNEKFVKMLCGLDNDKTYKLIGFNNSNFDNFLLADYLYTHKDTTMNTLDFNISRPFYNGTSLMNFFINGKIDTWDLSRHITGVSLKKCCDNFNVVNLAKKELNIPVKGFPHLKSHNAVQKLYEIGLKNDNPNYLIEVLSSNQYKEALVEYNIFDVISLGVCFTRYRDALSQIDCLKPYASKIWENLTIGGIVWNLFASTSEKNGVTWDRLTEEEYDYTLKDSVAGRVEMFNGETRILGKMASIDVCSLYPTICAVYDKAYFPTGKKVNVNFESIGGLTNHDYLTSEFAEKIGFFICDADQRILETKGKVSIYPKKKRSNTGVCLENLWDFQSCGQLEKVCLSSVTINQMIENGCHVRLYSGYYFEEKIEGHKLFPFVLEFMKGKNEQDTWKKLRDPRYNPSLRAAYKLFPNALTGKVIEKLHLDNVKQITGADDFYKLKEKYPETSVINVMGETIFVEYKKSVSEELHKQRPVFFGRLIYDYAKMYMWKYAYRIGMDKCVYTDTDSLKLRDIDYGAWKDWASKQTVPHWKEVEKYDERYKYHKLYDPHSKVFGSFEDEFDLKDAKINEDDIEEYEFMLVQKKAYLYNLKIDGEWINEKDWFRFKGVRPSSIFIDENDLPPFVELKVIHHITGKITEKYMIKSETSQHIITDYVNNHAHRQVINNSIEFFRKIYTDKKAVVLTSSFRKIVKGTMYNDDIVNGSYETNNNKIELCYSLKNLRL